MYIYKYKINKNDTVNRWWLSDVTIIPYGSKAQSFDGDVNYTEEYVQRVYPVRQQFVKNPPIDKVTEKVFDLMPMKHLYLPQGNTRVERSVFKHKANHLLMTGETYIVSENHREATFRMTTCGGFKLWHEDKTVADFRPYSRNVPAETTIKLKLNQGINRLRIYAEDLAERDSFFFFEMRYLDDEPITGILQVEDEEVDIKGVEAFLDSCYLTKDVYYDGPITIGCSPDLLPGDMTLDMSVSLTRSNSFYNRSVQVSPRRKEITVCDTEDLSFGVGEIEISIALKSIELKRELHVAIYPKNKVLIDGRLGSIQQRKKEALDFICTYGEKNPIKALALMEKDQYLSETAERHLKSAINKIREKEDNSVHFVGMLLLALRDYGDYLTETIKASIKEALITYRYWTDEIGNDVMWYFSESHSLLFHIAQYLVGEAYPEDIFTASNRTGEDQKVLGTERLQAWFSHFFKYGYGDWNAAGHMPMNLIGFLNLYELAENDDIRHSAIQCMDFTFRQITYHSHNGRLSSTFGRAYRDQIKSSELSETSFIEWIINGNGYVNQHVKTPVLLALSSYEPDDFSFDVHPEESEGVVIEMNQGQKATSIYTYKTSNYLMSSAQNFSPFSHGHQQHLMNISLGRKGVPFFINHPGELVVNGQGRPSYWAGNDSMPMIRQYKNTMMIRYEIPETSLVNFIHCYVPSDRLDRVVVKDQNLYIAADDAYLAVRFSHPIHMKTTGPTADRDICCPGRQHKIYLKCCSKNSWQDFETFMAAMAVTETEFSLEGSFRVNDAEYGILSLDKEGNLTVDSVPVPLFKENEILIERNRL